MRSWNGLTANLVTAVTLLVAAGCSDVPASNPFDPRTPAAQQATGRVAGTLTLPVGFAWDEARADGTVELRAAQAPAEAAFTSAVDSEGGFAFEGVVAGTYLVLFRVPTMAADPFALVVPQGEGVAIGEVSLRAVLDAAIQGVARRRGAGPDEHGAIFVQAVGKPFNALTNADGSFRMVVTQGTYTLRASADGYGSAERVIEVVAGEDTRMVEAIELGGAPASLRGAVVLPGGFDERSLEGLVVELFALGAAEPTRTETVSRASGAAVRCRSWAASASRTSTRAPGAS